MGVTAMFMSPEVMVTMATVTMDMAMVMAMEVMAMDMVVMDIVDTMERGLLMLSPAMDMVMAMDIATDIMDKGRGKTDGVLLIWDTKSSMTEHKKLIYRNLVLFSLVTFDNK